MKETIQIEFEDIDIRNQIVYRASSLKKVGETGSKIQVAGLALDKGTTQRFLCCRNQ